MSHGSVVAQENENWRGTRMQYVHVLMDDRDNDIVTVTLQNF